MKYTLHQYFIKLSDRNMKTINITNINNHTVELEILVNVLLWDTITKK